MSHGDCLWFLGCSPQNTWIAWSFRKLVLECLFPFPSPRLQEPPKVGLATALPPAYWANHNWFSYLPSGFSWQCCSSKMKCGPMNCQGLVPWGPLIAFGRWGIHCQVLCCSGGPCGRDELMGPLGGWRGAVPLQGGMSGSQDFSSQLREPLKPRTLLRTGALSLILESHFLDIKCKQSPLGITLI